MKKKFLEGLTALFRESSPTSEAFVNVKHLFPDKVFTSTRVVASTQVAD